MVRPRLSARIVAIMAALIAFVPPATSAAPNQEDHREEREDVRQRQSEVADEIDVLEATNDELAAALAALETDVVDQEAQLEEAERAAEAAEADLRDAEQAVADAEHRIAVLEEAIDEFVVEAYVNPPAEGMFDAFSAETLSDAAVKQVLMDLQSNRDADLLDQLELAHEDLELERANREEIAAEAEAKRNDAAAKLDELHATLLEQQSMAEEAEAALERRLAEAAVLEERDHELSEQIRQEEEALRELARQLEAQRQREAEAAAAAAAAAESSAGPSSGGGSSGSGGGGGAAAPASPATVTPGPGGLATVSCPRGGSITVASSIASNLQALLDHAARDGLALCGWGYRDTQRQIELRRAHCGTSHYAIYEAPASSCSPPTARPGQSMHERGLAVDFKNCSTRSTACFQWLGRHASSYGLYNLPSEPWHWSTNGG
jgi:LAS superfamily LD-carboxypeptidase LdcB